MDASPCFDMRSRARAGLAVLEGEARGGVLGNSRKEQMGSAGGHELTAEGTGGEGKPGQAAAAAAAAAAELDDADSTDESELIELFRDPSGSRCRAAE